MKKKTYLVVLALCTALAITPAAHLQTIKGETKSTAETQDTADKTDSAESGSDSDKKQQRIQLPEIQDLFLWMM